MKMQYPNDKKNSLWDGKEHDITPSELYQFTLNDTTYYLLFYADHSTSIDNNLTILTRDENGNFIKHPLDNYDRIDELLNSVNLESCDVSLINNDIKLGETFKVDNLLNKPSNDDNYYMQYPGGTTNLLWDNTEHAITPYSLEEININDEILYILNYRDEKYGMDSITFLTYSNGELVKRPLDDYSRIQSIISGLSRRSVDLSILPRHIKLGSMLYVDELEDKKENGLPSLGVIMGIKFIAYIVDDTYRYIPTSIYNRYYYGEEIKNPSKTTIDGQEHILVPQSVIDRILNDNKGLDVEYRELLHTYLFPKQLFKAYLVNDTYRYIYLSVFNKYYNGDKNNYYKKKKIDEVEHVLVTQSVIDRILKDNKGLDVEYDDSLIKNNLSNASFIAYNSNNNIYGKRYYIPIYIYQDYYYGDTAYNIPFTMINGMKYVSVDANVLDRILYDNPSLSIEYRDLPSKTNKVDTNLTRPKKIEKKKDNYTELYIPYDINNFYDGVEDNIFKNTEGNSLLNEYNKYFKKENFSSGVVDRIKNEMKLQEDRLRNKDSFEIYIENDSNIENIDKESYRVFITPCINKEKFNKSRKCTGVVIAEKKKNIDDLFRTLKDTFKDAYNDMLPMFFNGINLNRNYTEEKNNMKDIKNNVSELSNKMFRLESELQHKNSIIENALDILVAKTGMTREECLDMINNLDPKKGQPNK